MGENQDSDGVLDKQGAALNAQRFKMLEDIAKELSGEVVFPTYFDAAFRLRKALQDPELPIRRMATIVSLEPLVAARLMQLASSVLYSVDGTPPKDLIAAIQRLGIEVVKTTALTIAITQLMRAKETVIFGSFTRTLWAHSLKTAAATRVLAKMTGKFNPDTAMLAGLVHDLGAFYMLYRAVQYPELKRRPDSVKYLMLRWHESIGVSLLYALNIPEEVVLAVSDHDQLRPLNEHIRSLSDIVYVGNLLAGANLAWTGEDDPECLEAVNEACAMYADIMPLIENDTSLMQSVFT